MFRIIPIAVFAAALASADGADSPLPGNEPAPREAATTEPKLRQADRPDALPFEDPLARMKLKDDLWITKGIQGGFKTDDLWILQTPAPPAAAPETSEIDSGLGRDALGAWPTTRGAGDANRTDDASQAERLRQMQEWERFVFGEPKPAANRSSFSDPWGQRDNDAGTTRGTPSSDPRGISQPIVPPDSPIGTGFAGEFGAPSTIGNPPATSVGRPAEPATPSLSPFGPNAVPGLRSQDWLPQDSRSSPLNPAGALPEMPLDLRGPTPQGISAPDRATFSPFAPQMPGMGFAPPQNNFQIPGGPQGPVPAPRAHSTDSFMPRQPW